MSTQVNYEDDNLWCDECSAKIEAAYVETVNDDDTEDFEESYTRK